VADSCKGSRPGPASAVRGLLPSVQRLSSRAAARNRASCGARRYSGRASNCGVLQGCDVTHEPHQALVVDTSSRLISSSSSASNSLVATASPSPAERANEADSAQDAGVTETDALGGSPAPTPGHRKNKPHNSPCQESRNRPGHGSKQILSRNCVPSCWSAPPPPTEASRADRSPRQPIASFDQGIQ